jgi:hypothetical protein
VTASVVQEASPPSASLPLGHFPEAGKGRFASAGRFWFVRGGVGARYATDVLERREDNGHRWSLLSDHALMVVEFGV